MKPRNAPAKRFKARIRPGGWIVIPRPLLHSLGADPGQLTIELHGKRLVVSRRQSPAEIRRAKFKARLARISNVRNAAVDAMRRFMVEAPRQTVNIKALIEAGRD